MHGSPAHARCVGLAAHGVWDTCTPRESSTCAPHICGLGARLLPWMGAMSASSSLLEGCIAVPISDCRAEGKNAACWGRAQGACDKALGELCDEGSKLPSETRMQTSVYARLADRMEQTVIYDFMQYQTFPALPPPTAKEGVKAYKRAYMIYSLCSWPNFCMLMNVLQCFYYSYNYIAIREKNI